MRGAAIAVVLLAFFPVAAADHAVGHVVIPGTELLAYASLLPGGDLVQGTWCEEHVNASGYYTIGGIPVPRTIESAHVECHAAGHVIVTPDPFYDDKDPDQR